MFKHLLIPLDGSPLSEAAIPPALELASRFNSLITLLRVVNPPYIATGTSGTAYAELIVELRRQSQREAEEYLIKHRQWMHQKGYEVNSHAVEAESVAEVILEFADRLEVDGIVMSTHGRGGLSRWVYGSVADKVLRQAKAPVLLIRATKEVLEWSPDELPTVHR